VLYYEDLTLGDSAYELALDKEQAFTIGAVTAVHAPGDFLQRVRQGGWDLVVYASQPLADGSRSYDSEFAASLCQGQKAILTETRRDPAALATLSCAGATVESGEDNGTSLTGDADFLEVQASLGHDSRPLFSYALSSGVAANITEDARFDSGQAGVVGTVVPGGDAINWHANVLVKGLTKLTPFVPKSKLKTGDAIEVGVRILPSYQRAGGYPDGVMTVEVERPLAGLGSLVSQTSEGGNTGQGEDPVDSLERQIDAVSIPTQKEVYALNDRGENGDLHATNGTYMARLPINAAVDGMYTYHYVFEYPVGTCNARRELKQSLFVDVKISDSDSDVVIQNPRPGPNGSIYTVHLTPKDALGNAIGPGRRINPVCTGDCSCGPFDDNHDGSYSIDVQVPTGADLNQCQMEMMGSSISLLGEPASGVPSFTRQGMMIFLFLSAAISWWLVGRSESRPA